MAVTGEIIGLDIARSHITAARLISADGEVNTLTLAEIGVPETTFDDTGDLQQPELLTQALQALRSENKIKQRRCVIALPGRKLSISQVTRPASLLTEGNLEDSLRLEIEPGLLFDRHWSHLAYEITEVTGTDTTAPTAHILAVVADDRHTLKLIRAVKAAGWKVADVLAEPVALPTVINVGQTNSEILLSVGLRHSTLMLIRNGKLRYAQNLNFGGDHFTRAIAATGLDPAAAEAWKRSHSLIGPAPTADPYLQLREALRATADHFNEALWQIMTYDASDDLSAGVGRIVLCGGGALLDGLAGHLNANLGVPVELAEPVDGLVVADPGMFARHAAAYAVALAEPKARSRR